MVLYGHFIFQIALSYKRIVKTENKFELLTKMVVKEVSLQS